MQRFAGGKKSDLSNRVGGMVNVGGMMRASRRGNVLVGCLAAVGVVIVLLIIGGVIVAMNFKSWAASGMQAGVEAVITEMDAQGQLPDGEGPEMIAEVKRLTDAMKANEVSLEEVGEFFAAFFDSDVMRIGMIYGVELAYVPASGLSDEEKQAGVLALQRLAWGVDEGLVDGLEADAALEPLLVMNPETQENELVAIEAATDEQINEVIAAAKAAADAAEVPDENYRVDLSDMLAEQVDATLGTTSSGDAGSMSEGEEDAGAY